jgi:hypothetical protein
VFAAINGRGDVMGSALARTLHATQVAVGAALGLGIMAAPGFADVIDPQLFVCTGCTTSVGGDPNFINSNNFNVGSQPAFTGISPLLILVAIPGATSSTIAPTISLPSGVSAAAPGMKFYGLNNATSGTTAGVFEGLLTMASGGSAYTVAGIANDGGGSSQNFSNYTTSPFPGGGTNPDTGVTQFGIFAYAINFALTDSTSPLTGLDLHGGTLLGDFVMAYACGTGGGTALCPNGNNLGSTPFTVGGFISTTTVVPLPAALPLFATGLVGLGLLARRRKRAIAA